MLRAEINYGTSNSCQARQIPHLVEHLVLADTTGGKTLTDLLSNLGHHGISLNAVTLQDNTVFTITGPKSEAARIVKTLIETVAIQVRTCQPCMQQLQRLASGNPVSLPAMLELPRCCRRPEIKFATENQLVRVLVYNFSRALFWVYCG
ncbi:insulinase family protein [Pseudomonas pohangensis]|uniref:insulinase family protein n=1 Tax=Pseudomonas pohangensis TaxID=364197 RepID=UPI0038B48F71